MGPATSELHAAPTRYVPDRKLPDQLRLIEAVAFALGGEVRQSVRRQSRFRALSSLPLDRLHGPPG